MSLKASLQELDRIDVEIKRLTTTLKKLRKQKKTVEGNVLSFLQEQNQPGVKYNNNAIVIEKKETKKRKKKDEKHNDIMNVLVTYGVHNPEEAYKKILEANSGNVEVVDKLKVTKIKK